MADSYWLNAIKMFLILRNLIWIIWSAIIFLIISKYGFKWLNDFNVYFLNEKNSFKNKTIEKGCATKFPNVFFSNVWI